MSVESKMPTLWPLSHQIGGFPEVSTGKEKFLSPSVIDIQVKDMCLNISILYLVVCEPKKMLRMAQYLAHKSPNHALGAKVVRSQWCSF